MDIATPVEISEIFEEGEVRGDGPPKATWVVGGHAIQRHTESPIPIPGTGLGYLGRTHVACALAEIFLKSQTLTPPHRQRYAQSTQYVSQIVSHHTRS